MSDSEEEVEEFMVFADFKNQLLVNQITDPKCDIKIIGVDSDGPIAELNGNVFKGQYDYAVGTIVCFEKDDDAPVPIDPLFEQPCKQMYKYHTHTTKVLNFERIYVEAIPAKDTSPAAPHTHEADTAASSAKEAKTEPKLDLNITYEEAIKLFPPHANADAAHNK